MAVEITGAAGFGNTVKVALLLDTFPPPLLTIHLNVMLLSANATLASLYVACTISRIFLPLVLHTGSGCCNRECCGRTLYNVFDKQLASSAGFEFTEKRIPPTAGLVAAENLLVSG